MFIENKRVFIVRDNFHVENVFFFERFIERVFADVFYGMRPDRFGNAFHFSRYIRFVEKDFNGQIINAVAVV